MVLSELDELLGVSEGAEFVPSNRFRGSLEWIDELPTEPPLSIKSSFGNLGRDAAAISNAITPFDVQDNQALPRGSVLLSDNRRWRPDMDYDAGDIISGASKLRADVIPYIDPDRPDRSYTVDTETGEIKYVPRVHTSVDLKNKVRFDNPSRTTICIKRKIRREVLHALGVTGFFHIPRRFNPFSRVHC